MKIKIFKNKKKSDYDDWSIWECPPSQFNWEYEKEEHCFIIEGEIAVKSDNELVNIISGDYVIFPKGLKCFWRVEKSVKKYYMFK